MRHALHHLSSLGTRGHGDVVQILQYRAVGECSGGLAVIRLVALGYSEVPTSPCPPTPSVGDPDLASPMPYRSHSNWSFAISDLGTT